MWLECDVEYVVRKSHQRRQVVCSPFEVNVNERLEGARFPRLRIRSDSVEALGYIEMSRRMLMTNANRQRSGALLVPKDNVVASLMTVLPPMREINIV